MERVILLIWLNVLSYCSCLKILSCCSSLEAWPEIRASIIPLYRGGKIIFTLGTRVSDSTTSAKNAMERFCKNNKIIISAFPHLPYYRLIFRKFTITLKVQTRAVVRRTIYFLCFQSGVAGFITTFFKLEVYDTADNLGFKCRKRFVKAITFPANCKTLVPFTHAHVFRAIV